MAQRGAPLVRTTLSVLTTFPIIHAICMRNHRVIIGNVVEGLGGEHGIQRLRHRVAEGCSIGSRTTLSGLTTFPVFHASCMGKNRVIIGHEVAGTPVPVRMRRSSACRPQTAVVHRPRRTEAGGRRRCRSWRARYGMVWARDTDLSDSVRRGI